MFPRTNPKVILKWHLAKERLKEDKIKFMAFIISAKRPVWLNSILPLASSESPHLTGDAIDVFILPTSKVKYIVQALEKVEDEHPELAGGIGAYNRKNFLNGMVHIDIVRHGIRWGYGNHPDFPEDYYK